MQRARDRDFSSAVCPFAPRGVGPGLKESTASLEDKYINVSPREEQGKMAVTMMITSESGL